MNTPSDTELLLIKIMWFAIIFFNFFSPIVALLVLVLRGNDNSTYFEQEIIKCANTGLNVFLVITITSFIGIFLLYIPLLLAAIWALVILIKGIWASFMEKPFQETCVLKIISK